MAHVVKVSKKALLTYRDKYYERFNGNEIFLLKKTIVLAKVNGIFLVLFAVLVLPFHLKDFYQSPMLTLGDSVIIIGALMSLLLLHKGKYAIASMLTVMTLLGGLFIHNVIGDAMADGALPATRFFETLIGVCFMLPVISGFAFKKRQIFFAVILSIIFVISHLYVLIHNAHVDLDVGYVVYLVIAIIPGVLAIANLRIVNEAIESLVTSRNSTMELNKTLEDKVARRTFELQTLNEQLKLMSRTDALTGVANRRSMDEHLLNEWNRALRNGTPLAFLLFDLDEFKKYNDHFGHQKGDDCLIKIAEVLRLYTRRAGELAARYGGEEFAVILPQTSIEETHGVAEAIRKSVQALEIKHAPIARHPYVTVSIGVGILHLKEHLPKTITKCKLISDLIKISDEQLYHAKNMGRNSVGFAYAYYEQD